MKRFRGVLLAVFAVLLLWLLFRGPGEPQIAKGSTLVVDGVQ